MHGHQHILMHTHIIHLQEMINIKNRKISNPKMQSTLRYLYSQSHKRSFDISQWLKRRLKHLNHGKIDQALIQVDSIPYCAWKSHRCLSKLGIHSSPGPPLRHNGTRLMPSTCVCWNRTNWVSSMSSPDYHCLFQAYRHSFISNTTVVKLHTPTYIVWTFGVIRILTHNKSLLHLS